MVTSVGDFVAMLTFLGAADGAKEITTIIYKKESPLCMKFLPARKVMISRLDRPELFNAPFTATMVMM